MRKKRNALRLEDLPMHKLSAKAREQLGATTKAPRKRELEGHTVSFYSAVLKKRVSVPKIVPGKSKTGAIAEIKQDIGYARLPKNQRPVNFIAHPVYSGTISNPKRKTVCRYGHTHISAKMAHDCDKYYSGGYSPGSWEGFLKAQSEYHMKKKNGIFGSVVKATGRAIKRGHARRKATRAYSSELKAEAKLKRIKAKRAKAQREALSNPYQPWHGAVESSNETTYRDLYRIVRHWGRRTWDVYGPNSSRILKGLRSLEEAKKRIDKLEAVKENPSWTTKAATKAWRQVKALEKKMLKARDRAYNTPSVANTKAFQKASADLQRAKKREDELHRASADKRIALRKADKITAREFALGYPERKKNISTKGIKKAAGRVAKKAKSLAQKTVRKTKAAAKAFSRTNPKGFKQFTLYGWSESARAWTRFTVLAPNKTAAIAHARKKVIGLSRFTTAKPSPSRMHNPPLLSDIIGGGAGGAGYAVAAHLVSHALRKRKKKNGSAKAPRKINNVHKRFQGREAGRAASISASQHVPARVAQLGKLVEIKVNGKTISGFSDRARLVADQHNKLHIVGVQFKRPSEISNPGELALIGKLQSVTYQTRKDHLHNGGTYNFVHKLGEEGGRQPDFCLDHTGRPVIRNGSYKIQRVGIRD